MKKNILLLVCFTVFTAQLLTAQKNIWNGTKITFTKVDNADFTLASNQDRITDSVWITRKSTQSLFNIAIENSSTANSPAKTLWAYGTTSNLDTPTFASWNQTHGNNPGSAIGRNMILFIPEDSIYIDFKLISFAGGGPGGGFSYERSTEPPSALSNITQTKFSVYPNPTDGHFIIQSNQPLNDASIEVYSLNGALVSTKTNINAGQVNMDLPKGIYFIRLTAHGITQVPIKLMVQ